jgi:hypothetical protein
MSILPRRLLIKNDVRHFAIEHLRPFYEIKGMMRMRMTMTIEPKPQSVEEEATGL